MRWLAFALALLVPATGWGGTLAAARNLPAGTVITAADLRAVDSDRPGLSDPSEAIGMQTRITIFEGRPLHPTMLQAPRLVTRNQLVRVRFQRGTLRIEADGRTLSDGAAGDLIRVMNLDSRSTVTARVMPDGSVSVTN
ncbi:MAG: flagellar basal body P-ring formation chaperone FlgA [Paracoccus sp. (in: a-proteobacteria)]|uniref:flagellar basal body P-ring formation chaperone FlgA n=1 Tax=Paracoccus sp. TaxID=267 RepID=UPI003919AC96